ncbi:glycosyltransferase family 4 protein [Pseudanabaena biceps]|nr:glycosyltransferase family 4 protein [Pseudanabaena biceps]
MNSAKVLAIAESSMGHKTHIMTMQNYFTSSLCHVDICWNDQQKELIVKIINKILNFRIPNKFLQVHNLDLFRLRAQISYGLLARRLIARKSKLNSYNVLFFHTQALACFSLDLLKNTPTVVSIDMTNIQAALESGNNKFKWTYKPNIYIEKLIYQRSAKILTWTEWARNSVINDYDIQPEKVQVIPPGVDIKSLQFSERYNQPSVEPYQILFVGGDFKRKGGEDLLQVFLDKFASQAVLHIVTLDKIDCIHPNVHIYNQVTAYTPQWYELYQKADAFVMPTYGDAFGLVFIEAMAAGLPIIACNLTQTKEIVKDGETGFLIPPGDRLELSNKLQILINNPSLGKQMGIRARQLAEMNFDTQKNFQKIESIFEQLSQT